MWIVQQISFQPLTSLVSLLKRLWKVCLCHGTVTTKAWQKCMGAGMDFQAKEWSFLFRNGLIEHIGCKAGAMALSFIQCSHSHKILIFLTYYIHCYVFQLVCQYDDIPLASLTYCKRTFFPMCRMSGNVNTLVYFYLAVCTSVFIP